MDTPPAFALGDRVRTLIHLTSADWAPDAPGFPAGALGAIDYIHSDGSFGVLLDDDPTQMSVNFEASEIAAAREGR